MIFLTKPKILTDIEYNSNKIGVLSTLETENKNSLVEAINEVKNNSSSTAEATSVIDEGNYFNSQNVEGSLQEIGQTLNAMRESLITSANGLLNS